ncbi:hypothetical protein BDV96DRAFT_597887 [Lophiotrema nucula]|uniref:Uncharacterized protein n=1 Tax=Lophiotrema nucula TaxID=690887 RepID=A0A6A5ZI10_9PLEO|nr:hypothetical protein BDV96DRAFT_597887 [Lophiotrema nucula]
MKSYVIQNTPSSEPAGLSLTASDGLIRRLLDESMDVHAPGTLPILRHMIDKLNSTIFDIRNRADMEYLKALSEDTILASLMQEYPGNRVFGQLWSSQVPVQLERCVNDNSGWFPKAWQWRPDALLKARLHHIDSYESYSSEAGCSDFGSDEDDPTKFENSIECGEDKAGLVSFLAGCLKQFPNLEEVRYKANHVGFHGPRYEPMEEELTRVALDKRCEWHSGTRETESLAGIVLVLDVLMRAMETEGISPSKLSVPVPSTDLYVFGSYTPRSSIQAHKMATMNLRSYHSCSEQIKADSELVQLESLTLDYHGWCWTEDERENWLNEKHDNLIGSLSPSLKSVHLVGLEVKNPMTWRSLLFKLTACKLQNLSLTFRSVKIENYEGCPQDFQRERARLGLPDEVLKVAKKVTIKPKWYKRCLKKQVRDSEGFGSECSEGETPDDE